MISKSSAPNKIGDFISDLTNSTKLNAVMWKCLNFDIKNYDYSVTRQPASVMKYTATYMDIEIILTVDADIVFEVVRNGIYYDVSAWFTVAELSALVNAVKWYTEKTSDNAVMQIFVNYC